MCEWMGAVAVAVGYIGDKSSYCNNNKNTLQSYADGKRHDRRGGAFSSPMAPSSITTSWLVLVLCMCVSASEVIIAAVATTSRFLPGTTRRAFLGLWQCGAPCCRDGGVGKNNQLVSQPVRTIVLDVFFVCTLAATRTRLIGCLA